MLLNAVIMDISFTLKLDIFLIQNKIVRVPSFLHVRKEMFYLTMRSTHFIYGYMVLDIW